MRPAAATPAARRHAGGGGATAEAAEAAWVAACGADDASVFWAIGRYLPRWMPMAETLPNRQSGCQPGGQAHGGPAPYFTRASTWIFTRFPLSLTRTFGAFSVNSGVVTTALT